MDEERVVGPSVKKAQMALPRQGSEVEEQREWRDHVVDMLKVANVERRAAHTQLTVVTQALEYIAKVFYLQHMAGRRGLDEEWEGTVAPER